MKKALSIFMLSLFTSVTAWAITGSGTESDPYVISSLSIGTLLPRMLLVEPNIQANT